MMRFRRTHATIATGGAAVLIAVLVATPASAAPIPPESLADAVSSDSVMVHLDALQAIADANGGNRAVGTPGYEASGAYIETVLEEAGYTPVRQTFAAESQALLGYDLSVTGTADVPVLGLPMSGTTGTGPDPVSAGIVQPAVALGCDSAAWDGVDATGLIAIVSRGECDFAAKSVQASAAGAVAVLVYNNEPGELVGTLGEQSDDFVPSVGISDTEGAAIVAALAAGPVTATLLLNEETTSVETFNIIADTPTGREDNTVVLGAHLDSVPEGAGINDNGSGSAAILDVAVQLAEAGELNNQVRFAWWGAEEIGLLGSYHYVDDLALNNPEELDEIATYLNFDMVGSPNYVMSVYDANQSTYEAPVEVPEGSIATESVFTDYFDSIDQPWIDTAFDARSDYDGFVAYGIPASGLFTGADDLKTAEEAAVFGGVVGEQHDQNYHSAADDITNIDEGILDVSVKAIAYATASLANDTSAVNGVAPPAVTPAPAPTEPATPAQPPVEAPIEVPVEPVAPPSTPADPANPAVPGATPSAPTTIAAVAPRASTTSGPRALAQSGIDGGTYWTLGATGTVLAALGLVLVLSARSRARSGNNI